MGGDPDAITEEMRPGKAQSFGLIHTSPFVLLTHRLATEDFAKSKHNRLFAQIMSIMCRGSRDETYLHSKGETVGKKCEDCTASTAF